MKTAPDRIKTVKLDQPYPALAAKVAIHLRENSIFRFGNTIATVATTGEIVPMKAGSFPRWLSSRIGFTRPAFDGRRFERISRGLAKEIYRDHGFRSLLHELKGVSQVRLPVFTGEGAARTVELSGEGFNAATGIYTLNCIPYQEDMDAEGAWRVLWLEGYKDFAFDLEGAETKEKSRSFAVQLAAMLGEYCHRLFRDGTPRPIIVLNENQPGTSKSLLAKLILAPVHGAPTESGEPETEKDLESAAHDSRALVIDLAESGDATARPSGEAITHAWLLSDASRARFLAALWFIVRSWRDEGMPLMSEHVKPGFEVWTALIGGIAMNYGTANPCAPRKTESRDDESNLDLVYMIASIVGEAAGDAVLVLTTDMIIERAAAESRLELITPAKEPKRAIAHMMRALKGRHFTDTQGRVFEFGRRDAAKGARYPITFL